MAKEVSLTNAERLELSKILNTAKFSTLADMGFALEDAKAVVHTEEERTAINFRIINNGENIAWDENGVEKKIELSQSAVDAVLAEIKAKEAAGTVTIADQNLITLQAKLK